MLETAGPAVVSRDVGTNIVAVELAGDVTLEHQGELTAAFRTALNRDADVIADVTEATLIDASVIRCLLGGYHEATAQGTSMVFHGTREIVEHVLRLTGIEDSMPRARTREEAIETVKALRHSTRSAE